MTTILNFGDSSSSNTIPSLDQASLLSNLKLPTTFIIQPSSSILTKTKPLLAKRYNPAELGDLLLKKIKTQQVGSENNSSQQSPTLKENFDDNTSNCLESTSMIEEIHSPSTKSFTDEKEAPNNQIRFEGCLVPQRSISTPLIVNTFNLRHFKTGNTDSHKQVQHALETLQKRMMIEEQAAALRDVLLRVQLSQEPLVIPPLISSNSTQSSVNNGKQEKMTSKGLENEQGIIYGAVEYPLLAMAPPLLGNDFGDKESFINLPDSAITLHKMKRSTKGQNSKVEVIPLDSLSATRAETQMSESDVVSSQMSEDSSLGLKSMKKIIKEASWKQERSSK